MSNEHKESLDPKLNRYSKQIQFPGIGVEGQRKLAAARVIVIGCGALGSVAANLLGRAGVGKLVLVDRDFVELDNLQRQVLFEESDVGLPKAVVAAEKLRAINSDIQVEGRIVDVDYRNIESILNDPESPDVVIDGSDNFEIRFLINDACVKHGIPWIYGGCLGAEGQLMTILPNQTGCLNCLMPDGPPPPGTTDTCDSGGILSTIINVIASLQVNEAIKIMTNRVEEINKKLQVFDLWGNRFHSIDVSSLREKVDCPACKGHQFHWLSGDRGSQSVVLCGRNAVQVSFPNRTSIELSKLAVRLEASGRVEQNRYLVRLFTDKYAITVFQDGRAIISGTDDVSVAKKLYSQFIGA